MLEVSAVNDLIFFNNLSMLTETKLTNWKCIQQQQMRSRYLGSYLRLWT